MPNGDNKGDNSHGWIERKLEDMEKRVRDMEIAAAGFTSEYGQIAEDQDRRLQAAERKYDKMHGEHYRATGKNGTAIASLKVWNRVLGGTGSISGVTGWIKTIIESLS